MCLIALRAMPTQPDRVGSAAQQALDRESCPKPLQERGGVAAIDGDRPPVARGTAYAGNERWRGTVVTGKPRNRVSTTSATAASSPRTRSGWRPIPAIT